MITRLTTHLQNIKAARLIDAGLDEQLRAVGSVYLQVESGQAVSPADLGAALQNLHTARLMLLEISKRVRTNPDIVSAVADLSEILETIEIRLKDEKAAGKE